MHTTSLIAEVLNRSLIWALGLVSTTTFGSWMKLWPDLALGGNSLEQESFKYSRMVVFLVLLGPTIGFKGLKKVMMCLVSGTKLQIPFISILSTVLFLASSLLLVYRCLEDE